MKKDIILGRAKITGLSRQKLQRMSGIPRATFERRLSDPDKLTLGELRQLDQAARFEDEEILELVRKRR